ncbi:hypothetical protein MCORR_v1c01820 [Mesoplasma corruscae]|uniref:RDD domain-containing protein n=1 Tax=Mesoplasma corruscae TaxID=216874 RepID=A0A2S5RGU7_9MOLU|nr:hypothetical protein MCORR_v1c01820 [Mesoplasma corruscae]
MQITIKDVIQKRFRYLKLLFSFEIIFMIGIIIILFLNIFLFKGSLSENDNWMINAICGVIIFFYGFNLIIFIFIFAMISSFYKSSDSEKNTISWQLIGSIMLNRKNL